MRKSTKSIQSMLLELYKQHQSNKKWNTASLYRSVIIKVNKFAKGKEIPINNISPSWLKSFEGYMRSSGNCWNTISTYMRILNAAYNEAVLTNNATFRPLLFNKVYTGVVADRGNALGIQEMEQLVKLSFDKDSPLKPRLQQTLQYFVLMFLLRGMPFVDMAFLKKKELKRNVISYRRMKTGRPLTVELEKPAMQLLRLLASREKSSPYLFPFLHYPESSEKAYNEYKTVLRNFNNHLDTIGNILGIQQKITTYTARHTWVTIAFTCNINSAIISQSVGHSSIKVTEIYLKPFQQAAINAANLQVIQTVMS